MTKIEQKTWLAAKRRELSRAMETFGPVVASWDAYGYVTLINGLEREIQRLKTELNRKQNGLPRK